MGDIEQELEENFDEITCHYASFVHCVKTSIKGKKVETSDLRAYLMTLPSFFRDENQKPVLPADLKKELKVAENTDEIFEILTTKYASFLNYEIFKAMVDDYNIDNGQEKLNYAKYLKDYIYKHKISEVIPLLKAVDDAEKVVLKIDIESTRSMTHIVDIKKCVAKILGLKKSAVRIYDLKEGCVMVTLLATADVIFNSDKELTEEEVQDLSILWRKCNGRKFEFNRHPLHKIKLRHSL